MIYYEMAYTPGRFKGKYKYRELKVIEWNSIEV